MAKTKEGLNALKEEFETLNKKLVELTEEELGQVTGGCILSTQVSIPWCQFVQITSASLDCVAETMKIEEIRKVIVK